MAKIWEGEKHTLRCFWEEMEGKMWKGKINDGLMAFSSFFGITVFWCLVERDFTQFL